LAKSQKNLITILAQITYTKSLHQKVILAAKGYKNAGDKDEVVGL
jgi:hypothetical protein